MSKIGISKARRLDGLRGDGLTGERSRVTALEMKSNSRLRRFVALASSDVHV